MQKTVKDFYIFSIPWHSPVKYLSNKKNQTFLSFPWPEIFGRKGAKFFNARVILIAPTVYVHNWYHSHVPGIFYVYGHELQCTTIHGAFPLLLSPLAGSLLPSPFVSLSIPSYLLGTLLAVTGSVHLGLRLLVNWPPLTHPLPNPPPSKFPEPQSSRASLRRPQEQPDVFCREQKVLSSEN